MAKALPLDDILLVLLSEEPGTVGDLQRRHALIFDVEQAIDNTRVRAAVTRLERSGHLRQTPTPVRTGHIDRPVCALTPAGHRRQRLWLPDVGRDTGPEDIHARGILAVEAADQATFDAFVSNSLAVLRLRQWELAQPDPGHFPAAQARLAYEQEMTRALTMWLLQLPHHRRSGSDGPQRSDTAVTHPARDEPVRRHAS